MKYNKKQMNMNKMYKMNNCKIVLYNYFLCMRTMM